MKWITREHPKIDRIACPWLIKNFIDKEAGFIYAPFDEVKLKAEILTLSPSTFRMWSFHIIKTNALLIILPKK